MRTAFSGRVRRVAACTALALSAGMLLATPASAGTPVPGPVAEQPSASVELPTRSLVAPPAGRAGAAAASGDAKPLADLNSDGWEDTIFRAMNGNLYSALSDGGGAQFLAGRSEVAKDVVPIGNQGGNSVRPEVLVLSETGTLTMYQDAHRDSYDYEWTVGTGWQVYNKVFTPGDMNGDGRADVLARTPGGELFFYAGTGHMTGPLSTRKRIGGGWDLYDQLVGVGDANGDGKGDLYARDRSGRLWFYAATGDSSRPFATRRLIGQGWNGYNQLVFAGSGRLAARDNAGTVYLYEPMGGGTLSPRRKTGETGGWAGVSHFANSGALPHTGKAGIYARTKGGNLFWYGLTSRGVLSPRHQASDEGGWNGIQLFHPSSLDPDNMGDFGWIYEDGLSISGEFIGWGWNAYNSVTGPGDLSGDGRGDLLARDRGGVLWLYKGNGRGTAFSSRIRVGDGWSAYDKILGAGDYTGDGRADVLARTKGGDLYLYAGTGTASKPFKARKKIGGGWNAYQHIVAPGDMNADGKSDLLATTPGGTVYRYTNTAPGTFAKRAWLGTGFQVYNFMN
ncbi:VCBS repeat-containing protein [Streptomyces griseus]|uniref:FG-GAP repeat domain-containing protein n=1 Tax=Streptomyces griseus TaxID=1911 RepID=UPI0004C4B9F8|nr:FG-GAP-like repeat-containing protein [Streptomyces griseus]